MRDLVAGERAPVAGELVLALAPPPRTPVGLALVALDGARSVAAAFPPIDSQTRELRPAAAFEDEARLRIALDQLPTAVERLILVAFLPAGRGGLRELGSLALTIGDVRFIVDGTNRADTALILVELYRHAGGWRLAANGQGFVHGLAALASGYGIDLAWARRLEGSGAAPRPGTEHERPPPQRGGVAGGSGVAIDAHHILSNAHVVEDAHAISVSGDGRQLAADAVFVDPRNDLALLRVDTPLPAAACFRPGLDLHLGEDVVVLGFPLQGLLGSGPQASAGNVAALSGVGNDSTVFQFTAPIASGNSGGPILDLAGHVVGLVSSSLNLERVRLAGANAENINFGIKGAVIRSFVDAFGLVTTLGPDGAAAIPRAAMVRQTREALYRITVQC